MLRTIAITLFGNNTGLTLRGQLYTTAGATSGAEITTGFIEVGGGLYFWTGHIPADFAGYLAFYVDGVPGTILAIEAIQPPPGLAPTGHWFVAADGSDETGDGRTAQSAFATLAAARDAGSDGDTIHVGRGTFAGATTFDNQPRHLRLDPGTVFTSASTDTIKFVNCTAPVSIEGGSVINTSAAELYDRSAIKLQACAAARVADVYAEDANHKGLWANTVADLEIFRVRAIGSEYGIAITGFGDVPLRSRVADCMARTNGNWTTCNTGGLLISGQHRSVLSGSIFHGTTGGAGAEWKALGLQIEAHFVEAVVSDCLCVGEGAGDTDGYGVWLKRAAGVANSLTLKGGMSRGTTKDILNSDGDSFMTSGVDYRTKSGQITDVTLDQDIDSTGVPLSLRKSQETNTAVLVGDSSPNGATRRFYGRDGVTVIAQADTTGSGNRTNSSIP